MFEVERIDDLSLRVTSEYIKGRYVNRDELVTIRQFVVDRINAPDSEYSFSDFNANNYICERETNEIYNIDLDNYKRITVDERWDLFRKCVEQHERYQRWYGIDWFRNYSPVEPPDLNPENK